MYGCIDEQGFWLLDRWTELIPMTMTEGSCLVFRVICDLPLGRHQVISVWNNQNHFFVPSILVLLCLWHLDLRIKFLKYRENLDFFFTLFSDS